MTSTKTDTGATSSIPRACCHPCTARANPCQQPIIDMPAKRLGHRRHQRRRHFRGDLMHPHPRRPKTDPAPNPGAHPNQSARPATAPTNNQAHPYAPHANPPTPPRTPAPTSLRTQTRCLTSNHRRIRTREISINTGHDTASTPHDEQPPQSGRHHAQPAPPPEPTHR